MAKIAVKFHDLQLNQSLICSFEKNNHYIFCIYVIDFHCESTSASNVSSSKTAKKKKTATNSGVQQRNTITRVNYENKYFLSLSAILFLLNIKLPIHMQFAFLVVLSLFHWQQ